MLYLLPDMLQSNMDPLFKTAMNLPETQKCIRWHTSAQDRVKSISRKLAGGSTAVTPSDLVFAENDLKDCHTAMHTRMLDHAVLMRLPEFALLFTND